MRHPARPRPAALRAALTLPVFAGLSGWTAPAAAEAEAEAEAEESVLVRVDYRAPQACPDRTSFLAHVSARTARFRASDDAPRAFLVELSPAEGGFEGRLTTVVPPSARATRQLAGDTCEQVVAALALVAALTIDPNASAPPLSPPPPPPSPPSPPPPPPMPRARIWHFETGVGAGVTSGVVPDVLFALGPFVEGNVDFGALAPALRLSFQGAPATSYSVDGGGTASFRWWLATVEGCIRWTIGAFGLAPCARFGFGVLQADGTEVTIPRGEARRWADAGGLLRLRWSPVPFLFLEGAGGVVLPLTRDRFHFDAPDVTIHRAEAAGGLLGGDVGVRFP
jgi:hypothetical protein